MDGRSGLDADTEGEGGDGESLGLRPAENMVRFDPQLPAEPEDPEREAAAEGAEGAASEGATAEDADAQPGSPPSPAAEDEPAEPESPDELEAEAEPREPPRAKRLSKLRFDPLLEEPEGEKEDAVPAEARGTQTPRGSLTLSAAGGKESARSSVAERGRPEEEEAEAAEEERASEESEGKAAGGRAAKGGPERPEGAEDEELEWSEEVQRVQEQQLRSELLEQYHALVEERSRFQRYNMYLQHRINEALRKKKGQEAAEAPEKGAEPEAPEKEQAYLRYLARLEELKKQEADDLEWYHQELDSLKQEGQEKLARVEKEWRHFQALKKQVVMQVMGSCRMQGGRQAALRQVEQIQALEDKKEKEMSAVRLENVQLKQSLVHFETRMRAQEDLAEGLLLIDFEQLKIENQTFNEKVEERNEELLKLRSKVTNNVQIITHVKEKLHFMDMENACKRAQLLEIEAQVAQGRDLLTKTKQARDSLRVDNVRLNQKCGLLGKEALLRDLEEKVDKTKLLNGRLESLKRHHAGLTLSCKGVKQKIREARAFLPS